MDIGLYCFFGRSRYSRLPVLLHRLAACGVQLLLTRIWAQLHHCHGIGVQHAIITVYILQVIQHADMGHRPLPLFALHHSYWKTQFPHQ